MKPKRRSEKLLGMTRSKAKMYEYRVPTEYHIELTRDPARLFTVAVGLLGDLAARINTPTSKEIEIEDLRNHVRFSAYFFDSYLNGKFDDELDLYLLLIGSASYYLADLPGSASVLAKRLPDSMPDLGGSGLEQFCAWLLKGDYSRFTPLTTALFRKETGAIARWLSLYVTSGRDEEALDSIADQLRLTAYRNGSPRELLLADISLAILRTRRRHSTWYSLPRYSDQSTAAWDFALRKSSFISELWPAQHLIGQNGFLRGVSGVIQMPTSAGKTRATELMIRSEFLADRADLAVVVAPFRALCHEIKNSLVESFKGESVRVDELTDVFQPDFEIDEYLQGKQVIVVTPEKLVYVLRHNQELADNIGLLILDEGHQFDNGARGVTYELLLTSLKGLIPHDVQKVLISAVISNAEAINSWLNGDNSAVVQGASLLPTYRSIAFASWKDRLGRLEFVDGQNPDTGQFFVPRLIETIELTKRPRETKVRSFPEKQEGPDVALYLGLKLSPSGSVAIFCGTKLTVSGLCERAVEIFEREATVDKPLDYSDQGEVEKLAYLHEANLGEEAPTSRSARLGIFAHHGNTPHGLRMAIEHAMRLGHGRMVICTSTLAQGVNLPIRYLIVTTTQQGSEPLKIRDFHNLIGRAGRSGMHTEGSIIFANPQLYDKRGDRDGSWRWGEVKKFLQPENSEPCISTLLSIFQPLESDDGKFTIDLDPMELLKTCIGPAKKMTSLAESIAKRHADKKFTETGLRFQIQEKRRIVTAIESYLLAHWDETTMDSSVESLVEGTLAYHLAAGNETDQKQLVNLFKALAENIEKKVGEPDRRHVFGRTLFGVREALEIEKWVLNNVEELTEVDDVGELLDLTWPILARHIHNANFQRCTLPAEVRKLAIGWLKGKPFYQLFEEIEASGARFGKGKSPRRPTIDHVVDMCENGLAFDGMLVVGAVAEMIEFHYEDEEELVERLRTLQKRLKYGLTNDDQVAVYELGFSDRIIATELAALINYGGDRRSAREELRQQRTAIEGAIAKYPSYFRDVLSRVLT